MRGAAFREERKRDPSWLPNNDMHIRLMSNNQWLCDENQPWWAERGLDCSAACREEGFADFYRTTEPDVVGLQEVSALMLEKLLRALQKRGLSYGAVWGRDTPILYRTDRLELIDSCFLIYPKEVPEQTGEFNNHDSKSYCAAVFRLKDSGCLFTLMTTHLWWKSDDPHSDHYQPGSNAARVYQIGLAIDQLDKWLAKYNCPQILMGDLNTPYDSAPIRAAQTRGFSHAHDIATEYADETNGWHPCGPKVLEPYDPKPFREGIDHILLRNVPEGFVRRFERAMPESYLPLSDHAPAWIDAEI